MLRSATKLHLEHEVSGLVLVFGADVEAGFHFGIAGHEQQQPTIERRGGERRERDREHTESDHAVTTRVETKRRSN